MQHPFNMSKLSEKKIKNIEKIISNKSLPINKRKEAFSVLRDAMMNPRQKKDFNPETFDPMDDVDDYEVKKRERVNPEGRLPTMGLKPKKILEGQMVGMYESKQDLYLLIAFVQGQLLDKIEELEEEINRLKQA